MCQKATTRGMNHERRTWNELNIKSKWHGNKTNMTWRWNEMKRHEMEGKQQDINYDNDMTWNDQWRKWNELKWNEIDIKWTWHGLRWNEMKKEMKLKWTVDETMKLGRIWIILEHLVDKGTKASQWTDTRQLNSLWEWHWKTYLLESKHERLEKMNCSQWCFWLHPRLTDILALFES